MHPVIEQACCLPEDKLTPRDVGLLVELTDTFPSAFVTGTGLWSPSTANDFDVCVCATKEGVKSWVTAAKDCASDGSFGSLRIGNVNIVCLSGDYFDKWKAATAMMSALKPITVEHERHGVFEALCGIAAAVELRAKETT